MSVLSLIGAGPESSVCMTTACRHVRHIPPVGPNPERPTSSAQFIVLGRLLEGAPTRPSKSDSKSVAAWERRRRKVGTRISKLGIERRGTQEQLAFLSGLSRNVLLDVEHGRRGILHERLFDIARHWECRRRTSWRESNMEATAAALSSCPRTRHTPGIFDSPLTADRTDEPRPESWVSLRQFYPPAARQIREIVEFRFVRAMVMLSGRRCLGRLRVVTPAHVLAADARPGDSHVEKNRS